MTDSFLQKLEEKVMILLTELEALRKELTIVRQENASLKSDKANYTKKLQGLLALMDSLESSNEPIVVGELQMLKGQEEYATVNANA